MGHRRRAALGGALVTSMMGALALCPSAPAGTAAATGTGRGAGEALVLVAAPDFLNQDVGDVRSLPGWDPGDPNSSTPQLQRSIRIFLDEIASLGPASVLVSGDLVGGHWLSDADMTGIFGPSGTVEERARMLAAAGHFYHGRHRHRFAERGLVLHAALGDHDIGDNPWIRAQKRARVPLFKRLFAAHYTRRPNGDPRYARRPVGTPWAATAYAVRLGEDALLVTVDVFHHTRTGVSIEVVGGQLRWLRQTLRAAESRGVRWIIVQGHTPIAGPVRMRSSSGLMLEGGTRSRLWEVMARYGVDIYLAGEVHDTTMRRADGITQISTGGLLYLGAATYLTMRLDRRRADLEVREFDSLLTGERAYLWQLGGWRTSGGRELVPGSSLPVGMLRLTAGGRVVSATGKLIQYPVSGWMPRSASRARAS